MSKEKVTVGRLLVAGFVACASFFLAPAGWADFKKGKAAFERRDYALAYQELLPEAQAGNPEAEYMIGELTADGLGTRRSAQVAAGWYKLAARHGYEPAYVTLGFLYLYGAGSEDDPTAVAADPAKAAEYLKAAADQGDKTAEYLLGQIYLQGDRVKQDYAQAYRYTVRAANRGVVGAQFNAGFMTARGLGTPRNPVEAYKWFSLAAQQRYPAAAKNREVIRSQLTPEELQKAKTLVQDFRAHP